MNDCEILTFLDYLAKAGGSERFDFWKRDEDGEFLIDYKGNYVPDMDAAYKFGQQIRDQNSDVEVDISNNVVRISIPVNTTVS